ncbi:MAG: flagellar hook-basal body complex protein [Proteobacteria bacterium]|nr:flagellar hook-basal body complex protein [Pseudomonadota bacterium]
MLGSMFSGISGLMSNSQAINVVGNNIANVNTIGFKGSRATFSDLLYQSINGTAGASQVGRGSTLTAVDTQFAQGSFESTTEPTDLAIGGKGFFVVKRPEGDMTEYYTRAGQFRFDKDGNLANPTGLILQGKAIDTTTQKAVGVDTNVIISQKPSDPQITTAIDMTVNLQSNAVWKGSVGSLATTAGTGSIASVTNTLGKWPIAGDYTATTVLTTPAVKATGTVTSSGVNVTAGDTVTIAGKIYTFVAVPAIEGNVLIGADAATTLDNLKSAINHTGTPGTDYFCAAAHPTVTATTNTATVQTLEAITAGTDGNVALAEGAATLTASGAALTGGTDDVNTLTVAVTRLKADGVTLGDTVSESKVITAGTSIANFEDLGVDITPGSVVAAGTQTFNVSGFNVDSPTATANYSSAITVYDSNGQSHVVTAYFRKSNIDASSNSIWEWMAVVGAGDAAAGENTLALSGDLTFDDAGVLQGEGSNHQVFFNFTTPAQQNQPINLSFGTLSAISGGTTKDPLTQYPIDSATNYQAQDGFPPGTLTSVSVDAEGIISGHYSNGQIIDQYQITLANFGDPVGLTKEGNNLFSANNKTGDAYKYAPGVSGTGKINPNSLEQSNVDLATEFVKMIVAQRGFQANSRVITTSDEILQELMNLKR